MTERAARPRRHRDARRDDRCDGRRDAGVTYVELVITIVLVGVVVLPILAAVQSSIRGASVSRAAAEVETVLINAVDAVNAADTALFGCNLTEPAQSAASSQGAPWDDSAITVEHEYLHRDTSRGPGDEWVAFTPPSDGTCPADAVSLRPTGRVLRVSISVTSPNEGLTRTLEVVKSVD